MKAEFKEKFIERYSELTDFDIFKEYSLKYIRKAIRVNTIKIRVDDVKKRLKENWNLKQVPWCKEGFWIEDKSEEKRRDIGNLPEHSLGYIYVQEDTFDEAISTSDLSLCNTLIVKWKMGECYGEIATMIGDASVCDNLPETESKNSCYNHAASRGWVAGWTKEYRLSLCEKISDSNLRPSCIGIVGI